MNLCLIGVGSVFDTIAGDAIGHGLPEGWSLRRAESVAVLSSSVETLLEGLLPTETQLFVAVDQNALNHARLELYGAARLRGLRLATLVHARAIVAPDAKLADNVWIGAGALIGSAARIDSNVMVNPAARIDGGARIGMHGWIGPGAVVGAGVEIGQHGVIGADVRLRAGLRLGKHCVVDTGAAQTEDLAAGSFLAPHFPSPARIVGAGYSHQKQR
ncbi:hypothetical protein GT347_08105 [Xylophilus rhododendri]|uniref:Acetyltransferase n=1 Tax=Xylophilus rhododendri TaxID=2697032 RepID=A0A857J4B3_9BURK|nr:hypothetical protein [Xylophilus rhododendri]QHI97959.1 hypothetical protein GT347_08105 [Xylophilus rhododendri]